MVNRPARLLHIAAAAIGLACHSSSAHDAYAPGSDAEIRCLATKAATQAQAGAPFRPHTLSTIDRLREMLDSRTQPRPASREIQLPPATRVERPARQRQPPERRQESTDKTQLPTPLGDEDSVARLTAEQLLTMKAVADELSKEARKTTHTSELSLLASRLERLAAGGCEK